MLQSLGVTCACKVKKRKVKTVVGTGWICTLVCFLSSGDREFWQLLPSTLLALGDFKIISDFTIYVDFKSSTPQTAAAIGTSSATVALVLLVTNFRR